MILSERVAGFRAGGKLAIDLKPAQIEHTTMSLDVLVQGQEQGIIR